MNLRRFHPLWILVIAMPLLGLLTALVALRYSQMRAASVPEQVTQAAVSDLIGQPAPNFELATLEGGDSLRLSSLRGHLVFLNFWATWCDPCRREFPAFAGFTMNQPDARVVAVNMGDDSTKIEGFLKEISLGSDAVSILLDSDLSVSRAYSVDYLPATFVIDAAGQVVAFHPGEITAEDLAGYLAQYG